MSVVPPACWEDIGGYIPHRAGGIDWMAVITARMKGWKTESFREKWFFHYRRLGTAERGVHSSLVLLRSRKIIISVAIRSGKCSGLPTR